MMGRIQRQRTAMRALRFLMEQESLVWAAITVGRHFQAMVPETERDSQHVTAHVRRHLLTLLERAAMTDKDNIILHAMAPVCGAQGLGFWRVKNLNSRYGKEWR